MNAHQITVNKQLLDTVQQIKPLDMKLVESIDRWIEAGFDYCSAYQLASNNLDIEDFEVFEIAELKELSANTSAFLEHIESLSFDR